MSPIQQMLLGVGAVATKTYVDDVFSTYLYKGNSSTQSINNGIDLSGEGGLTWIKARNDTVNHFLYDTERGAGKQLHSNTTNDEHTDTNQFSSFNNNGFSLGNNAYTNDSSYNYSSWTFRKAKGWFDIQEYNGNSGNVFNLSHDLGCKPCFIIIKQLNTAENWIVWIKGLGSGKNLRLNLHNDQSSDSGTDIGHTVTSSYIRIPNGSAVNGNSSNSKYICYLWGDGAESEGQIFGESGDKSLILTGTYSSNQNEQTINLGWEPSWILIKKTNGNRSWFLFDTMRGIVTGDKDEALYPNSNSAVNDEGDLDHIDVTSTGFIIKSSSFNNQINDSGGEYVYVAIRAATGSVTRPPSLGTDVFNVILGNSNGSPVIPVFAANFPVDFALRRRKDAVDDWDASARLTQGKRLKTNTSDAESGSASAVFDSNVGWNDGDFDDRYPSWQWKRHAGFDCIAYKGDGVAGRQISHSMNNTVQMIWIKNRDSGAESDRWVVGADGLNGGTNPWTKFLALNEAWAEDDDTMFNDTAPTSTAFTVGNHTGVNDNNENYLAMLFSSVLGISKIGYFTGSGSSNTQTISTGFAPRFLVIKRTDAHTSWFVFDTTRGWGSGDDKSLSFDASSAQFDNDFGAPTSTGFTITGNGNTTSGKFIYYAHS